MNTIIVRSINTSVKTIPARGDRAQMQFTEQTAAIDVGEEFPRPFKLTLEPDQKPYAPGHYCIDPASLVVNKYDALELGRRIKLLPLPTPAAK